jgi:hypothetical protein
MELQPVPEESLILVSILPGLRDLEIARLLGWYRIPLKSAPKVVDVDYLAFYQTSAFGEEHRWRIEYICPVRGHELVTRAELFHDEMDHKRANEEYFKLSLGPLELLPKPISAGNWKRITFLYTIGELLNRAETIYELVVHSNSRQMLWQSLRDRLAVEPMKKGNEEKQLLDDPILIEALLQWMDYPTKKSNNLYGRKI